MVEKGLYKRDLQMGFLSNGVYANKNDKMPTGFFLGTRVGGVIEI